MYVIFPLHLLLERPHYVPADSCKAHSVSRSSCDLSTPRAIAHTDTVATKVFDSQQSNLIECRVNISARDIEIEPSVTIDTNKGQARSEKERREWAMAAEKSGVIARELAEPGCKELLKGFNNVTFKLVKTVSEFTLQLSHINEQHADQLRTLVDSFRKKNAELRNERPSCNSTVFQSWENLLQEVETDSQYHAELATVCGRQLSRSLVERTFHRKVQSRKILSDRDEYEIILNKQHQQLQKSYKSYCDSYLAHVSTPSSITLTNYFHCHNQYVRQLHASNAMITEYDNTVLPTLLQEMEQVHGEVVYVVADGLLQVTDLITKKSSEQSRRYESLSELCKSASGKADLLSLARFAASLPPLELANDPTSAATLRPEDSCPTVTAFVSPTTALDNQLPAAPDGSANPTQLKNALVLDHLTSVSVPSDASAIKRQCAELEVQQQQLEDSIETKVRQQNRSLEASLYNKCNDLQEEISSQQHQLLVTRLHLAAAIAQRELFSSKSESFSTEKNRERRASSAEKNNMKTKWLKAFRSLKTTGISKDSDRKNGRDGDKEGGAGASAGTMPEGTHWFQEYTYKKITACDACNEILRGHTRQGLKCRLCRMNVHAECQPVTGRCQPRSRLLRRQKSASELESRRLEPVDDTASYKSDITDPVYSLLKQAAAKRKEPTLSALAIQEHSALPSGASGSGGRKENINAPDAFTPRNTVGDFRVPPPISSSTQGARRQLPISRGLNPPPNLQRGISSSSDCTTKSSPESNIRESSVSTLPSSSLNRCLSSVNSKSSARKEVFRYWSVRRRSRKEKNMEVEIPVFDPDAPASPVHNRRLLQSVTRGTARMSSLDLPDDLEKSQSSASVSPCPSPQKPHRLLPATLYVVLFNFQSRHEDELDLTAGSKLTVVDSTNPNWWKGKCLGRVGFFPSNYVTKLMSGERPLQVTHNLQLAGTPEGLKLLRDQIVIQTAEQVDGMVMIRDGENRVGSCPLSYLVDV